MAEDVTPTPPVPALFGQAASPAPVASEPEPEPPQATPHRYRFLFVYSLLGAVLAVGIAGLVVFAGGAINPGPSWSSWKPSGGGEGAAKQIADHVGKAYRLPTGEQLVDVIAKSPAVSPASTVNIPIHYIAIKALKGQSYQTFAISSSNSIMYSLCGLGQSCAIASGKASVERGTLVRREILELALYTFKYTGIKSVIAFMPPTPGTQPKYVVYLQKNDVAPQLRTPLANTLGPKVPLPATIPAREVHTIDASTESRVYSFSLSQAQTGDAILVLSPLAA